MTAFFGFLDESGVLPTDPSQPFFALGLFLIADTAGLYEKLQIIRSHCINALSPTAPFEFKFSSVTSAFLPYYKLVIDELIGEAGARFCILVLDKNLPKIDPLSYFPSAWEAYVRYSEILLKNNYKHLDAQDQIIVLADYLGRPKASSVI